MIVYVDLRLSGRPFSLTVTVIGKFGTCRLTNRVSNLRPIFFGLREHSIHRKRDPSGQLPGESLTKLSDFEGNILCLILKLAVLWLRYSQCDSKLETFIRDPLPEVVKEKDTTGN